VPRLRRTAFAIGTAACMAAAFATAMTAPASAQTTASAAPAAVSAPATAAGAAAAVKLTTVAGAAAAVKLTAPASAADDCISMNGYNGAVGFWRCTGTTQDSPWVWTSCNEVNNNAKTYFNVYIFLNYCSTRVWLHQNKYPDDEIAGWAVCAGPSPYADSTGIVNSADVDPENIQVTSNKSDC
jgi:hypothetical protein